MWFFLGAHEGRAELANDSVRVALSGLRLCAVALLYFDALCVAAVPDRQTANHFDLAKDAACGMNGAFRASPPIRNCVDSVQLFRFSDRQLVIAA